MGVANRRFSLIFIIGGMQIDFKCLALAVSTNPSNPLGTGDVPVDFRFITKLVN